MNKTRIIIICFLIPFAILAAILFLKVKSREDLWQRTVLTRQVMRNLLKERQDIVRSVPADGLWYNMRRRKEIPGILEVQIKDQNNGVIGDFKIKVSE